MPVPLRIDDLSHTYRKSESVLDGVSVSFPSASVTAVMGPSGCGKTTLLQCASGLLPVQHGRVLLAGRDLKSTEPEALAVLRRDQMGFVFQSYNLLPSLSALDNVALPLRLGKSHDFQDRAQNALTLVGLGNKAASLPGEMSGGEQQRVAVARAIVINPEIIFADEPTGALDSASGVRVLDLLMTAAREQGCCVVMVTHDPFVASQADRVVYLRDGKIVDEVVGETSSEIAVRLAELEKEYQE